MIGSSSRKKASFCAAVGLLRGSLAKVVEIGGETEVKVFLGGQLGFEGRKIGGERFSSVIFLRSKIEIRVHTRAIISSRSLC